MSKLNADAISTAIYELEATARAATIKDILIDLRDSLKSGMTSEDTDTWESGFKAAIETITANYSI